MKRTRFWSCVWTEEEEFGSPDEVGSPVYEKIRQLASIVVMAGHPTIISPAKMI